MASLHSASPAQITSAAPAVLAHGAQYNGQYLIFALGGESFAIDILHIKEIIEFNELTEVPLMPGFVRGVINLRGAVVPVIDLRARFGRGNTEVSRRTCIVIVEQAGHDPHAESPSNAQGGSDYASQDIGVMVDAVNEVVDIPASEIEPPPSFGSHMRPDFISGMGKHAGQFVIMLQLDTVLSVDDMSELTAHTTQSIAGTGSAALMNAPAG